MQPRDDDLAEAFGVARRQADDDLAEYLTDINAKVTVQSDRVGGLQQAIATATRRSRLRAEEELAQAIRNWLDLVHIQETVWREMERRNRNGRP